MLLGVIEIDGFGQSGIRFACDLRRVDWRQIRRPRSFMSRLCRIGLSLVVRLTGTHENEANPFSNEAVEIRKSILV